MKYCIEEQEKNVQFIKGANSKLWSQFLILLSSTSLNWICLNSLGEGKLELLCLKLEILCGFSENWEGTPPLQESFNECLR